MPGSCERMQGLRSFWPSTSGDLHSRLLDHRIEGSVRIFEGVFEAKSAAACTSVSIATSASSEVVSVKINTRYCNNNRKSC